MFEDLLKKIGLGNTTPTTQGKDALNQLLANTGTGVQYTEPTQQNVPYDFLEKIANTSDKYINNSKNISTPYNQDSTRLLSDAIDFIKPILPKQTFDNYNSIINIAGDGGILNAKQDKKIIKESGFNNADFYILPNGEKIHASDVGNFLFSYGANKLGIGDNEAKLGGLAQTVNRSLGIAKEKGISGISDIYNLFADEIGRDWKYYDKGSAYAKNINEKNMKPTNDLIGGFEDAYNSIIKNQEQGYRDSLSNVIGNVYNSIKEKGSTIVSSLLNTDIAKEKIGNATKWTVENVIKPGGTILGSLASAGIGAFDNAKTDRKYIGRGLDSEQIDYIQSIYDANIDDPTKHQSIVDGINKQISIDEKGDIQGVLESMKPKQFTDVNQVADFLLERNSNNQKSAKRADEWSFETQEQKAKSLQEYNTSKQDPVYLDIKSTYEKIIQSDPEKYLNPIIKSNLRGGYETILSEAEGTLRKLNTEELAMDNANRSEEDKQQFKLYANNLKGAISEQSKQLLNDLQYAADNKLDFQKYVDEKYKDVGGIDGYIQQGLTKAGFSPIQGAGWLDVADNLSSTNKVQGTLNGSYDAFKQGVIGIVSLPFQIAQTGIRNIQGAGNSSYSAGGVAGLADVDFSGDNLYSKSLSSYAGEAASLIPDIALTLLPGGQWKGLSKVGVIGKELQVLKSANSIKNAVAYVGGTALRGIDYGYRGVSLAKDVATLGILDDIVLAKNVGGLNKLEQLAGKHYNILENAGIAVGKTAQELAKDNAISAMFSNYITEAYGGQKPGALNDVYMDLAFNVIDLGQAFKSSLNTIEGLQAFKKGIADPNIQNNINTFIAGQSGVKSLSLRQAEELGNNISRTVPLVGKMLEAKTPEDMAAAIKQLTGEDIPLEKIGEKSQQFRQSLAKNIVNTVLESGGSEVQQIAKLREIDNILKIGDKNFVSIDSVISSLSPSPQSAFRANLQSAIKTNADLFAEQGTFKEGSIGAKLGLTSNSIDETTYKQIETENTKELFTRNNNGEYILNKDKYDEVGYIEKPKDIITILSDNSILDTKTLTELKTLNAEDALSKAIGNILC